MFRSALLIPGGEQRKQRMATIVIAITITAVITIIVVITITIAIAIAIAIASQVYSWPPWQAALQLRREPWV